MKTASPSKVTAALLGLAALAVCPMAQAATHISTSTTGTNTWSSGTGWDSTPVSGIDTILTFGNGTSLAASAVVVSNNDIAGVFKLNNLNMTYAGPASGTAPTVTISGNQLEFINNTGAVAPTMVFNTTGTVKPTVTISAPILFTNTTAITTTTDAILNGTLSGTGGFTKAGAGKLTIQGAATASGGTALGNIGVSAGILQIGANGGFGSLGNGTITLSGSGSLNVARASNSFNLDNTITGSTSGAVNFTLNNSATPTAFAVTLTKANTYTAATNLQPFSASSVGTPTLKNGIDNAVSTTTAFTINTVSGSTANMTYDLNGFDQTIGSLASGAGVTTTNGIVTNSGAAKTLTISNTTGTTTYAGLISGAIALTKSGNSTQILSGSNSYSGLTSVNGGVLQINHANALGSTAAGTTVNGSDGSVNFVGTVLDLNGVAIGSGESLTLDSGTTANFRSSLRTVGNSTNSWAGGVALAGSKIAQFYAGTFGNTASTLVISGAITSSSFTGSLTLRGVGTGTLSGGVSLGGTTQVTVNDGGTWNISGSNTWGNTFITSGSLVVGATNALPTGTTVDFNSTAGALKLNGNSQTVAGLTSTGGAGTNKVVNGSVTASTLTVNNSLVNSFSGVLGGTGTNENNFGITKSGASTLTLNGVNTYTGNTTISTGALVLADNAELRMLIGSNGFNNQVNGSGTITLNGDFRFDLTGAGTTVGNSWNIITVGSLAETFGGTFLAKSTLGNFTNNSGIWSISENSVTYEFSQATGLLSVVPEPSTWALLAFSLTTVMVLRRRRSQA